MQLSASHIHEERRQRPSAAEERARVSISRKGRPAYMPVAGRGIFGARTGEAVTK